jgi:hypothetical protein
MPGQEPQIDFARIDFPSDALTLKRLRQLHPEFEAPRSWEAIGAGILEHLNRTNVPALVAHERRLARNSFETALGRKSTLLLGNFERADLVAMYVEYGLASGVHHANQLLRAVEEAGARQAREHMQGPPAH